MQLGIKGGKQCFRGGPIPLFRCDNERRDCRSHVPSQAAGYPVTASPNGDSFSQIDRIVKPRFTDPLR
jgi:hypothetical protein